MKKPTLAAFALVLAFVLHCGSSPAADGAAISITHKLGTISVPRNPKRVVVMDYGTLDTMDTLGIAVRIALPKSNLPSYLAKYTGDVYTDVGGLKEFNLETINAFKPDFIVISGRQQDYYKELSSFAPVLVVDNLSKNYLATSGETIAAIGKIFAKEDAVATAWSAILANVARVREKAAAKNEKALVLLTNDGKISVYGSGSRFGLIHDDLGLPQADPGIKVGVHGQLVNYEYLAMVNPDIIFVVDRSVAVGGKADGGRLLDNALVNATKAARNNRIVPLDPNVWYLSGGGLQSIAAMVGDIERALDM